MSNEPSTPFDTLPYRPCVGVALFNDAGQVFIGRRIGLPVSFDERGMWQLPQGGIDEGEDALTAAQRELEEEIGVPPEKVEVLAEAPGWLTYDLPDDLLGKVWGGKYRGQKQKWFAFRLLGDDRDINLNVPGHRPEFDLWRWEKLERIPALVVPFKRHIYEAIVDAFADIPARLRGQSGNG